MPESLTALLNRVPAWQDRPDIMITFLAGGITNQNYRVDVGRGDEMESFVMRLGGAKTELLGIDRANEYAATKRAAEIGIAPEVVGFLEPEGVLIARFIRGRAVPPQELSEPQGLAEVGRALCQIHALAPLKATFSPFQIVRVYDRLAREHGVTAFPENYAWLRERMQEIETALARQADAPVFCHNDLLNGNFLRDEQNHLRILDWEYAGMGDRFFDLGNFAAHHDLSDDRIQELLAAYFENPLPGHLARLRLMQAMSDFREAMWGVLQQGISTLDFDFRSYADQFFEKLTARLNDGRYALWIGGA